MELIMLGEVENQTTLVTKTMHILEMTDYGMTYH